MIDVQYGLQQTVIDEARTMQ